MPGARDGQLRVHRGADTPPWTLLLWDDAGQDHRDVGWTALITEDDGTLLVEDGRPVVEGIP